MYYGVCFYLILVLHFCNRSDAGVKGEESVVMTCKLCHCQDLRRAHRRGMEKLLCGVFPVNKYRCRQCYSVKWTVAAPWMAPFRYLASFLLLSISGLGMIILSI